METKYDKIKGSEHYNQNILQGRSGHNVPLEEVEVVVCNPIAQATQADKRERYWGHVGQDLYRVVVSAAVSAGYAIGRVVTVHRDKNSKVGKPS